jgi:Tn3 transposase DDE domain
VISRPECDTLPDTGAERFDLSSLPPNRRAWLAQTGRQQTNQALARMAPERRYPVLLCFCVEALERATDDAIEIYDRTLGGADRAAQRKREELERRGRRDIQTTVRRFIDLSQVVLEAHDSGGDVWRLIERRIGIERLREDLDRARGVARPQSTGHLDLLIADSAAVGRKLLTAVIASLELRSTGVDEDELRAALRLIRQLTDAKRRWLPGFSPSAFIDAQWRPRVVDSSRGRFDRRSYELCAAYELRSSLRAGRVLQAGSRRNPLAQALQKYGRLVKTNFILTWLADEELRSRIGRQLNKGEQLHALRRAIFYASKATSGTARPTSRASRRSAWRSWSTRSSRGTPSTPAASSTSSAPPAS